MRLVIDEIPPSNNKFIGRTNRWEYQEEKQRWHWLVKGKVKERPCYDKSIVTITYYFKDKRRRDPDNYSGKMLLDALVRERVIKDDSFDCITLHLVGCHDAKHPRTEIEIKKDPAI